MENTRDPKERLNNLRKKYDEFVIEDRLRKERNKQILQKLQDIRNKAVVLQSRTDSIKSIKWQNDSIMEATMPQHYTECVPERFQRLTPLNYIDERQWYTANNTKLRSPTPEPRYTPFSNYIPAQSGVPPYAANNYTPTIDDIVKEISKKYILIPREGEYPDKEKLLKPDRRGEKSNVAFDVSESNNWREKYEILNKLNSTTLSESKPIHDVPEKIPVTQRSRRKSVYRMPEEPYPELSDNETIHFGDEAYEELINKDLKRDNNITNLNSDSFPSKISTNYENTNDSLDINIHKLNIRNEKTADIKYSLPDKLKPGDQNTNSINSKLQQINIEPAEYMQNDSESESLVRYNKTKNNEISKVNSAEFGEPLLNSRPVNKNLNVPNSQTREEQYSKHNTQIADAKNEPDLEQSLYQATDEHYDNHNAKETHNEELQRQPKKDQNLEQISGHVYSQQANDLEQLSQSYRPQHTEPAVQALSEHPSKQLYDNQHLTPHQNQTSEQISSDNSQSGQPFISPVQNDTIDQALEQQPIDHQVIQESVEQPHSEQVLEPYNQQPLEPQYDQQQVDEQEYPIEQQYYNQQPIEQQYDQQPLDQQYDQQPLEQQYDQQPIEQQYDQQPIEQQYDQQPIEQQYDQQPIEQQYDQQPLEQQYDQQPLEQHYDQQLLEQQYDQHPIEQQYDQQPLEQQYDQQPIDQQYDKQPLVQQYDQQPLEQQYDHQPYADQYEGHGPDQAYLEQPNYEQQYVEQTDAQVTEPHQPAETEDLQQYSQQNYVQQNYAEVPYDQQAYDANAYQQPYDAQAYEQQAYDPNAYQEQSEYAQGYDQNPENQQYNNDQNQDSHIDESAAINYENQATDELSVVQQEGHSNINQVNIETVVNKPLTLLESETEQDLSTKESSKQDDSDFSFSVGK